MWKKNKLKGNKMAKIQETDLKYLRARFGTENVTVEGDLVVVKSDMSDKALDYIEEKTILDFVKIRIYKEANTSYIFTVTDNQFIDKLEKLARGL